MYIVYGLIFVFFCRCKVLRHSWPLSAGLTCLVESWWGKSCYNLAREKSCDVIFIRQKQFISIITRASHYNRSTWVTIWGCRFSRSFCGTSPFGSYSHLCLLHLRLCLLPSHPRLWDPLLPPWLWRERFHVHVPLTPSRKLSSDVAER